MLSPLKFASVKKSQTPDWIWIDEIAFCQPAAATSGWDSPVGADPPPKIVRSQLAFSRR
jgi:hypothetical protein